MEKIVEVSNIKKNFGNFEVLKGISFEIKKGEIFGLIGPNGAGKTTTLRILTTIIKPDSGKVKILGYDLQKNSYQIKKVISYLPEEAGAYKNLSGKDYLSFMAEFFAKNKAQKKKILERGCELANLGKALFKKTSTYSKGMLRKLLLAKTLMTKPKLAILDEPTSGLDVLSAIEIREKIKSFSKEGVSFLISSHNMLEMEYLCQRIALINKGEIIEKGSPAELKKKYQASNLEEVFVKAIKK